MCGRGRGASGPTSEYRRGAGGFRPNAPGSILSGRRVELCGAEKRVRQGPLQIPEPEPYRVERASHSLARIYTDGRAETVGELAGDSRRLVDVPVKGEKGALCLEELPDLARAHVDVAVDQVERRPVRGAMKRAHQRPA